MEDYSEDLLIKFGHTKPIKAQLLPYKHTTSVYGTSKQFIAYTDTSAPLDAKGILRVQTFFGALLYYGRAVVNKLMVALSAIGYKQSAATVDIPASVEQLLDYIATYPHYGITYRTSDIILAAHSDTLYFN